MSKGSPADGPARGAVIIEPAAAGEMDLVRALFLEYAAWLDVDLCFQHFDEELATLPGAYASPDGGILLARIDAPDSDAAEVPGVAGCVAFRALQRPVCEMKRLWVRPAFRGRGIGSQLVHAIMDGARAAGYRRMVLDTLETMTGAVRLYTRCGFTRIAPYYNNPLPGAVYLGSDL